MLIVGLGGLGSPVALYLAAAGVGTLGVVDADDVELSNLHRQLLHTTPRVGQSKVLSAKRALAELNPHVQIIPHVQRFDADTGRAFKDTILSQGDGDDPMKLFVDFMGREPRLEPLLVRTGIPTASL